MQVEIDFNFIVFHNNEIINHETEQIIRYAIVEMLRDCGYGSIINEDDGGVVNTYARPFNVGYSGGEHNEFFVGYTFPFNNDIDHGNLSELLTQGIPHFFDNMTNQLPDIRVYVRTTYIPE